jgi:hypothetical protein
LGFLRTEIRSQNSGVAEAGEIQVSTKNAKRIGLTCETAILHASAE